MPGYLGPGSRALRRSAGMTTAKWRASKLQRLPLLHMLLPGRPAAERALRQPGFHERVEVAVEHGAGIGGLHAGAQVLHHLVGLQNVGADLVAPADVGLGRLLGGSLLLALLHLELVE